MADENQIGQDEIDALLNQGAAKEKPKPAAKPEAPAAPPKPAAPPAAAKPAAKPAAASGPIAQSDIELLLRQAEEAIASVNEPTASMPAAKPFQLRDFTGTPPSKDRTTLELIRDVELDLKIELGRTHMPLEDVLRLRKGSVVPLDKLAGDPVDIYVNGRLIARGEVLVLNDNFCVRVAELITSEAAA